MSIPLELLSQWADEAMVFASIPGEVHTLFQEIIASKQTKPLGYIKQGVQPKPHSIETLDVKDDIGRYLQARKRGRIEVGGQRTSFDDTVTS